MQNITFCFTLNRRFFILFDVNKYRQEESKLKAYEACQNESESSQFVA